MQKPISGWKKYSQTYAPGVHVEEDFGLPQSEPFLTGVPAFLGRISRPVEKVRQEHRPVPRMLSLWSHFDRHIGKVTEDCYLGYAVRGFFENGGRRCYVVDLKDDTAAGLEAGLDAISGLNTIDLVCAPDLVRKHHKEKEKEVYGLQQMVVNHCESMGNRFAILDSLPEDDSDKVWNQWSEIDGKNGALYYPWVKVQGFHGEVIATPPCGHVAGVYARTDQDYGVHKAPANAVLEGVVSLELILTDREQADLNPKRVNCLRVFPGRGIRVWGARTLSGQQDWTYVNVRRLFLTVVRWIEWNMWEVAFEPNDAKLWARIERELCTYLGDLYRQGALKGDTPQEAFYVKCNAETNPPEDRDSGQVVTEIGLATTIPFEFIVVRLIHGASGVSVSELARPEPNS
jgi:Bacteriophage tail sheath protein